MSSVRVRIVRETCDCDIAHFIEIDYHLIHLVVHIY